MGDRVTVTANRHTIVLVDAMEGVRDALRWLLSREPDLVVTGEAGTVALAAGMPADVVVTGLRLADGAAADLAAAGRRVVVHTWLPPDEYPAQLTAGVCAVVRHGALGRLLAPAIRQAVAQSSSGREPDRDSEASGPPRR